MHETNRGWMWTLHNSNMFRGSSKTAPRLREQLLLPVQSPRKTRGKTNKALTRTASKSFALGKVGRYVIATRDIHPMELILMDNPAVFGPNHDTRPACMECLMPVDGSVVCEKCKLPLCGSQSCETGRFHSSECQIFSQPTPTGFKFKVKMDRPV